MAHSVEDIAVARDTPAARRTVVLELAYLALNKGGWGITKSSLMSKAWWTGFMLKNLPALQRECPFLADEPIDGSDLPILQELTLCYAELCATRAGPGGQGGGVRA